MGKIFVALVIALTVSACSPEVGSDEWGAKMKERPTGDWTQTETVEFAKNCVIKFGGKDDS